MCKHILEAAQMFAFHTGYEPTSFSMGNLLGHSGKFLWRNPGSSPSADSCCVFPSPSELVEKYGQKLSPPSEKTRAHRKTRNHSFLLKGLLKLFTVFRKLKEQQHPEAVGQFQEDCMQKGHTVNRPTSLHCSGQWEHTGSLRPISSQLRAIN